MKKQSLNKQTKINIFFLVAIIGLGIYTVFLNYEIAMNRAASESVDKSLAEGIFQIHVDAANKEANQ